MRPRSILTIALGAFLIVALITIARQAAQPRASTQPPVTARTTTPRAESHPPARPVEPRDDTAGVSPGAAAVSPVGTSPLSKERNAPAATIPPANPRSVAETRATGPRRRVVATYFHGNVRCVTCRKVEAYAKEAIEAGFQQQMKAGLVEFCAVNVDDPANKHYIDDFQLVTRSVVVTDEADGAVERWVKLDNVWGLVGNRDAYLAYVQDAVHGYLETR